MESPEAMLRRLLKPLKYYIADWNLRTLPRFFLFEPWTRIGSHCDQHRLWLIVTMSMVEESYLILWNFSSRHSLPMQKNCSSSISRITKCNHYVKQVVSDKTTLLLMVRIGFYDNAFRNIFQQFQAIWVWLVRLALIGWILLKNLINAIKFNCILYISQPMVVDLPRIGIKTYGRRCLLELVFLAII